MGGNRVSGKIELERKYGLSYHTISPRWLRFIVCLNGCISPNQRGFFNFIPLEFRINREIGVHAIQFASGIREVQTAIRVFGRRCEHIYPKAVSCLFADEEELLTFFRITDSSWWSQRRTTNAIGRRFRELRRRTRPMGVFSDITSMERILYAVFSHENFNRVWLSLFLQ